MKQILIFGAGRSSLYLLSYLRDYGKEHQYELLVCDKDTSYAALHLQDHQNIRFIQMDISQLEAVSALVASAEMVVSLLPAALHIQIARLCLEHGKHLATASYISDEMNALHKACLEKNLLFMNECGLDPGIDHMSAMQIIDDLKQKGALIKGFRSYCGGLVADADDGENPWKYKFSWNPRNVILAAQGAPAVWLEKGRIRLKPYARIFRNAETFRLANYGHVEAYPNRDSLKYRAYYGLDRVEDMLRGTFRKPGYCSAWNVLVNLGMTDDHQQLEFTSGTTLLQWLQTYLPSDVQSIELYLKSELNASEADLEKLKWIGLMSDGPLPLLKGTSAQILEALLLEKWKLEETDKDLVLMLHEFTYELHGKNEVLYSEMVLEGKDNAFTAMAKTVGLPLAIVTRLILESKIQSRGVLMPVQKEVYQPVLAELESLGIRFTHRS